MAISTRDDGPGDRKPGQIKQVVTAKNPVSPFYIEWVERLQRVLAVWKLNKIKPDDFAKYQLFLLTMGQFNANFTLDELERLEYPPSPFAIVHRHTYLRSTDTWAMDILHIFYKKKHKNLKVFPLFVDSVLFWPELERYCLVINANKSDELNKQLENYATELVEKGRTSDPIWIRMDDASEQKESKLESKQQKNSSSPRLSKELSVILSRKKEIESILKDKVLNKIKENKNLSADQVKTTSEKLFKKLNNIAYFFADQFEGIETLVFCDKTPNFVNSVMGNLGYRIDPVRAIRHVLTFFPKLFFDVNETKAFWDVLMMTSLVTDLTKNYKHIKNELKNLLDVIIENIKNPPIFAEEKFDLCEEAKNFPPKISTQEEMEEIDPIFRASIPQTAINLYGFYVRKFVEEHLTKIDEKEAIRLVVDSEMKANMRFIERSVIQSDLLPKIIRSVQSISEIMLLTLEHAPIKNYASVLKARLATPLMVEPILITPYAMRAFVRVFQILQNQFKNSAPKVYVTNQSYFEWLQNLERLDARKAQIYLVQHLAQVDKEADVIFMELHPNNVVEAKQFAHDINLLLANLKKWPTKKRTLVMDVTLNAIDDREIKKFLEDAAAQIRSGSINVVLIQSLTKFSQLGLDQRSAGSVIVFNNKKDIWEKVNREIALINQFESIDRSTEQFFAYFAQMSEVTSVYHNQINENVRLIYEQMIHESSELELINRERFRLTMSSDPKACYVALNMQGLLPDVDDGLELSSHEMEDFVKDLMKYLIYPLCDFHGFPLTERMSIGFPLTSMNAVFDSLRFTIGLESTTKLYNFISILVYVTFVLNRQGSPQLFFEQDEKGEYSLRKEFFTEKYYQFAAVKGQINYEFEINNVDSSSKIVAQIKEGEVTLCREIKIGSSVKHIKYSDDRISVHSRIFKDSEFSSLSESGQTMAIACLSQHICRTNNVSNIRIGFDEKQKTVEFEDVELPSLWDNKYLYGPFYFDKRPVCFDLYDKHVSFHMGDQYYPDPKPLYVKQGDIVTPLMDIPIHDREFLFREGAYENPEPKEKAKFFRAKQENKMRVMLENDKLIIEHDFVCCSQQGVTIYKRFIKSRNQKTKKPALTCFEIDCWSIKDPIFARFLRLIIAVYVKEKMNVDFVASNKKFIHFLFTLSYDNSDKIFSEAIKDVMSKKEEFYSILKSYQNKIVSEKKFEDTFYSFNHSGKDLIWPSGAKGVIQIMSNDLIAESLRCLNLEPKKITVVGEQKGDSKSTPIAALITAQRQQTGIASAPKKQGDQKAENKEAPKKTS